MTTMARPRWLILLIAAICANSFSLPAIAQQVWFGPRGPDVKPGGAADWAKLFKQNDEWDRLSAKINVFVITAGYVVQASDSELQAMASDLSKRHISLALGSQSISISNTEKCGHQEGYEAGDTNARAAEKLRRNGAKLSYLALDEPVWFGHYEKSAQGCQFSPEELAARVGTTIKPYTDQFPDLIVGDIEPVPLITTFPDWQAIFEDFSADLRRIAKSKLQFLQTDVNWRIPSYGPALSKLHSFAKERQMAFGVIYNGDGTDRDGVEWVTDAVRHFETVEDENGLVPDQAILETWDQIPTKIFPATIDGTLGSLVFHYTLPKTRVHAEIVGGQIVGHAWTADGRPLRQAHISVLAGPTGSIAAPKIRQVAGVVPDQARFAMMGIRINTECLCSGPNDILLGEMVFDQDGIESRFSPVTMFRKDDNTATNGAKIHKIVRGDRSLIRVTVKPDQSFGFNSPAFSVRPGQQFTFSVPLGAVDGLGMYGDATIIWFDQNMNGLRRTNLNLRAEKRLLTECATDHAGKFTCPIDRDRLVGHPEIAEVWTKVGGNATSRGDVTRIALGSVQGPNIPSH